MKRTSWKPGGGAPIDMRSPEDVAAPREKEGTQPHGGLRSRRNINNALPQIVGL